MLSILLFLNLFISNPKKVILGTWTGSLDGRTLTIVIEKINGDKLIGYDLVGNDKYSLSGIFYEVEWDQPCSRAYEAVLAEEKGRFSGVFTLKFIGYEDQKENDCGIICIGNLKGVEGQGEWKSYMGKKVRDVFIFRK